MNDNIFVPHYTPSEGLNFNLEGIDRQKWLIENMLIMPKHEAWLRREVTVRRASGTTRIEGGGLDETAVGKLVNSPTGKRMTDDEQMNLNAIEAYEFIDFLSDQPDIPIDELAIRQINRLFIKNAPANLTPGVYRNGQNKILGFVTPDQGDVPGLMRSFALWLRKEDDMNPVLKAGITHIHMVAVHPFWDGNGRTARGLATLILQRNGYGFRKLLDLESNLFDIRDNYFEAIRRTLGSRFRPDYDPAHWLQFFSFTMSVHAQLLANRLTDWHRMMQKTQTAGEEAGLSQRQVDGLMFAMRVEKMTRRDYIEVTETSPGTASRDLAGLVKKGFLSAEGNTRSRVYQPVLPTPSLASERDSSQLPLLEGDDQG
jgi:Fic family protein